MRQRPRPADDHRFGQELSAYIFVARVFVRRHSVNPPDHFHALYHPAERSETLAVGIAHTTVVEAQLIPPFAGAMLAANAGTTTSSNSSNALFI